MAVNKYTEARRKANEKYNAKTYDEIKVRVLKGRKDEIKSAAEKQGQSLNGYIVNAIDEKMERNSTKE